MRPRIAFEWKVATERKATRGRTALPAIGKQQELALPRDQRSRLQTAFARRAFG